MFSIAGASEKRGPFKLKMLSNGVYQIHQSHGQAFEGTKDRIFNKATEMGVFQPDLSLAVEEMDKLGHDCAHFGIGGHFIFTELSKGKKFA